MPHRNKAGTPAPEATRRTNDDVIATPFATFYSQVERADPVLKDTGRFTRGYIVTDTGGVSTEELLTIAGASDFKKQIGESPAACLKEQTGSTFAFPSY